jgi:putative peptidoglycan lipid II flippase
VSIVTGLSFAQLLIQFAIQLVLARLFGAGTEMDAYVAALAPPTVIAAILSGSLGYVLVPVFSDRLLAGGQREALHVTAQVGIYLVILSGLTATAVGAGAQPIADLMCPGFSAAQRELTARLLCLLGVLIETNSLIAFLNAVHHCHRRFALPALAGVVGTLATLGYVLLFQHRHGIDAVAWGVVIGSATTVLILIPQFIRDVRQYRPLTTPLQSGTRQALVLLAPLVFASLFWRLDPLLDRFLGSYLSEGSISHLGYAWRLTTALMMIGTSGLTIVAFPALAGHAAAGQREALNSEVAYGTRFLLFLLVPVSFGLAVFHEPVTRLLFERGKFTPADTQAVALLVVIYLGVVVGGSFGDLFSRTFYALQDMRTPVIVSIVGFVLAAAAKVIMAGPLDVAGLAAATSLYFVFNAVALATILVWRLGGSLLRGSLGALVRYAIASALGCLAALLIAQGKAAWLVLPAAAAGASAYLIVTLLFRDEFALKLLRFALGRPTIEGPS